MKLDNRGWGYRSMIIYSCILLSTLLVACYFANYLYNDLQKSLEKHENDNSKSQVIDTTIEKEPEKVSIDYNLYKDLEDDIYSSTLDYLESDDFKLEEGIKIITSNTLVSNGYMSRMKDQNGEDCTGYSNVLIDEDLSYSVKSYISCNLYTSEGY